MISEEEQFAIDQTYKRLEDVARGWMERYNQQVQENFKLLEELKELRK